MEEVASGMPGLISITEQPQPGGGATLVFEIEDDKVEQFFAAFGLQPGDQEGFQRVVIEAIEMMLARQQANDASEEAGV